MRLRTFEVLMAGNLKPFKLSLYKGAQVLDFLDDGANPHIKLLVGETFGDEYEDRVFCFYQANSDTEIPEGAKYIATCKGKYWVPFTLFEVTGCEL